MNVQSNSKNQNASEQEELLNIISSAIKNVTEHSTLLRGPYKAAYSQGSEVSASTKS